ncbi:DUF1800 domain-containing protein [Litoreibacter roseus]|uniref:DUF1800 family protein n=1 Tax=Litoreibacter roseus TaxID=2601869 RepID=A0A6N6JMG8_9RHOB|nr:DUF1800 domain-containing protein [Litoreibacter roseus]GFE66488.1 hypothetical protein KIN_35620 [Litoreibacter roseus]
MKSTILSFGLLSTTMLVVSGVASFAQDEQTALVIDTTKQAPQQLSEAAKKINPLHEIPTHYKLSVPVADTYVLSAPPRSRVQLRVDGELILDLSGADADADVEPVQAFTQLSAGSHLVEIVTDLIRPDTIASVAVNKIGEAPISIVSVAQPMSAAEAEQFEATEVAALQSGASSQMGAQPRANRAPGTIGGAGSAAQRTPFQIGGGASRAAIAERQAALAAARSGGTSTPAIGRAMSGGGSSSGGGTPQVVSVPSSGGVVSSGGGGSSNNGTSDSTSDNSSDGNSSNSGSNTNNNDNSSGGGTTNGNGTGTGGGVVSPDVGGGGGGVQVDPNMASLSPLSPPTDVTLTQAVQLTAAGTSEGVVSNTGQTLFGAVMDPTTFDTVNVAVAPSNRTTSVDVGPTTGQFAVRLFPEDFDSAEEVTVTLTGAFSGNDEVQAQPVSYTLTGGDLVDGVGQVLSRITYGPTPELYARVRAMGFSAYIEEQLNPASINNAAFEATNPDNLLEATTRNSGSMFRSIMHHNLAHAAFSEKQLQEVMGEFWWNHFHASTKGSDIIQQAITDRQFFRDNAFGRFEDLLLYSARSPLMSQFLDNDQSRRGNLNENYGREILELHTVGVNGGYSDEDVIAVSRIFTGWRYRRTNPNAEDVASLYEFEFQPDRHDEDDKAVPFLNTTIVGRSGAAGVQEGEELIALLASHPRTQAYVCGKIVQKFVTDAPPTPENPLPQRFIDLCTAAWGANDGNSAAILRAILTAPEFVNTASLQRTSGKTPFEYAASVIRSIGATPDTGDDGDFYRRFREATENAGQSPLYFPVPTGLPEVGIAWTNSASMIARYRSITDVAQRSEEYNFDLAADAQNAGLETAEEVAAYLLAVATADRYTVGEFDALVGVLKGEDGIFEPRRQDEKSAYDRAIGLLVVLPSFQLQ